MAIALYNYARMVTNTLGTGTLTLAGAVSGCLTFDQAGASDGDIVFYSILDGAQSEFGIGRYTASGTTLTRDVILRSTGGGNNTAISLSGNAQVFIDNPAEAVFPRPNIAYNGAMEIDQANEGASVTIPNNGSAYVTDGYLGLISQANTVKAISAIRDTTVPAGFVNSLKTSIGASAYSSTAVGDFWVLQHRIEANELVDCGFGAAGAKTFAIAFWFTASVTGTYGVALQNAAQTRSYVSTISVTANTWKLYYLIIPGDITGTWVTSGIAEGMRLSVVLAAGSTFQGTAGAWTGSNILSTSGQTQLWATASATANMTGVRIQRNGVPTPFIRDGYSRERTRCMRHYEKSYSDGVAPGSASGSNGRVGQEFFGYYGTTAAAYSFGCRFKVPKRAAPTVTVFSPTTGTSGVTDNGASADVTTTVAQNGTNGFQAAANSFTPNAIGNGLRIQWTADARL